MAQHPQTLPKHRLQHLKHLPRKIHKNPKVKIDANKTEYAIIRSVATSQLNWKLWGKEDLKDQANLIWVDTYITEEAVKRLKPYQRINHFPNSQQYGRKNLLSHNLKAIKTLMPQQYDFFPLTWVLPQEQEQFQKFQKNNQNRLYILKPTASCQGRGIYLSHKVAIPQKQSIIAQEYIQNPLLIDNMKFDFRIYVLLKNLHPLTILVYKEGLARLACHHYQPPNQSNLSNYYMHLTNYAINKSCGLYEPNRNQLDDDKGHKRSYSGVMDHLKDKGYDTNQLQLEIDKIILKTILAGYSKLLESYKNVRDIKQQTDSVCFEILGFDIMVTDTLQPKLIEVNHTPSFCTDSPLDYVIKKHLILDTMNLLSIDHQDKIQFQHKKAQLLSPQRKYRSLQLKNIKINQQGYQKDRFGGYRKIYPCDQSNAQPHRIMEAIMKKYQDKTTKKQKLNRLTNYIQYSMSKQEEEQLYDITLDAQQLTKNQLKAKYFNFSFYNLLHTNPQTICKQKSQKQQINRYLFLERENKKNITPFQMKNIVIDFDQQIKTKIKFYEKKRLASRQNEYLNSIQPVNRYLSLGRGSTSHRYKQQIKPHQKQYQFNLNNSATNRLKLAQIRLQKIKNKDQKQLNLEQYFPQYRKI